MTQKQAPLSVDALNDDAALYDAVSNYDFVIYVLFLFLICCL